MAAKATNKLSFKQEEMVVYPTHGVGQITAIEIEEIAGLELQLYVIKFEKEKMTLRVPVGKASSVGMRGLSGEATLAKSLKTLKGRPRVKRTMWSRRAQEYESKINSGDIILVSEVVRDLYRSENQPEQSYSERQLYEAALERLAREVGAIENLGDAGGVTKVLEYLNIGVRSRQKTEEAKLAEQDSSDTAAA
ncbi:MAG: CarD family transcriptional regulator [Rhizobiales bacterium]|nr:CarD family transcriptional regulator [Hyphomicrobiales bacterium]NRB15717.1 CarD family transcriptional regulator [Hyphomicrobiales bacterium]